MKNLGAALLARRSNGTNNFSDQEFSNALGRSTGTAKTHSFKAARTACTAAKSDNEAAVLASRDVFIKVAIMHDGSILKRIQVKADCGTRSNHMVWRNSVLLCRRKKVLGQGTVIFCRKMMFFVKEHFFLLLKSPQGHCDQLIRSSV